MGSWFKKHISKPSQAVVKGIVRTPTNIVHSVTNVAKHPLDIKAWGNLALQANPVTAIPRSYITENSSQSLNRKIDLVSGVGSSILVGMGAGTLARVGIASAGALASSPSPSVDTGGEVLSPTSEDMPAGSTSFSDYADTNGAQLLNNTPSSLPADNGNIIDNIFSKGKDFISSLGTGLTTSLKPKTTNASVAGGNNTLIYVVLTISIIAMLFYGMGSHKK